MKNFKKIKKFEKIVGFSTKLSAPCEIFFSNNRTLKTLLFKTTSNSKMFLTELLATVFFLWVTMKYPTPLHVGLGFAIALYFGGQHINPAISFMQFLGGQMSQQRFLQYTAAHLLAAWIVVSFLR